jgi:hypothetical protein
VETAGHAVAGRGLEALVAVFGRRLGRGVSGSSPYVLLQKWLIGLYRFEKADESNLMLG